jgi:signal transduction histidine kinase
LLILDFLFAFPHFLGGKIQFKLLEGIMEMEEEVRRKIMEPFYTTKEVGKGTRLGLSISYSIIEDHRGAIEIESEMGVGLGLSLPYL